MTAKGELEQEKAENERQIRVRIYSVILSYCDHCS